MTQFLPGNMVITHHTPDKKFMVGLVKKAPKLDPNDYQSPVCDLPGDDGPAAYYEVEYEPGTTVINHLIL